VNGIFSQSESEILEILGRRKMKIREIAEQLYDFEESPEAGNVVAGMIRRINVKCKHHRLPWYLNGEGTGRGGRTVWRDKR